MPLMAKPVHDFHCNKRKCIEKERKETGSTKLVFIKKWRMNGRGGVWIDTGLFECPNCNTRFRKHIGSGRDAT